MPRVYFVKKARKDYPAFGIKKGDSYYWWKFRYGGIYKSKTRPRPSQLTQSEFLGTIYAIIEEIQDVTIDDFNSIDELRDFIEEKAEEIRILGEEQEDKLYNMPESLQDSETGWLLQDRADACYEIADELENIDTEIDEELSGEEIQDRLQEIIDEMQNVEYNGE